MLHHLLWISRACVSNLNLAHEWLTPTLTIVLYKEITTECKNRLNGYYMKKADVVWFNEYLNIYNFNLLYQLYAISEDSISFYCFCSHIKHSKALHLWSGIFPRHTKCFLFLHLFGILVTCVLQAKERHSRGVVTGNAAVRCNFSVKIHRVWCRLLPGFLDQIRSA